jgi:hypothetical protein
VTYPGAYDGVLAVSAVDARGLHPSFANRGSSVAIAAPGIGVEAAWKDGTATLFSGTSASTPFVSGALAWLLSANPDLKPSDAAALLTRFANDTDLPGVDPETGAGILSVRRLQERDAKGIYDVAVSYPMAQPVERGDRDLTILVYIQNHGTEPLPLVELTLQVNQDARRVSLFNVGVGQTLTQKFGFDLNRFKAGSFTVTASASISGHEDAYPYDNTRRVTLSPVEDK